MKWALAALVVAACGKGAPPAVPVAAGCPVSTAAGFSYPSGPYGDAVGSTFANFSLADCDGKAVAFDGVLSGAQLVLLNVGAGWCQPCIEETAGLDSLAGRFCARGLRIVQVLFQDEQSRPATKLFCGQWRARFGLTFPVLADPLFTMQQHLSADQTPLNLLVDRGAVVRYRVTGVAPADLAARIDALLPP